MVFAKVAVPFARFSQSEESLAKHEKQFELTASYKSHSTLTVRVLNSGSSRNM